ncbi:MAG: sigma-70 family RNA polymerase sigma factor [Planctomycetota bacterium]
MPATTRLSLIARITDSDDSESWAEFVSLYGPFVYSLARTRGLQDADACDVVQEVMREIAKSVSRFDADPELGRFRSWVSVIARRTMARYSDRNRRHAKGTGDTANLVALSGVADRAEEDLWEREHQRHLFQWAAKQVRGDFTETTWLAFWRTAVDGVHASAVAEECHISVGAVYIAKSRVAGRLRERLVEAAESGLI